MTEQGKKISVIIPAYNAEKYLGEALDSVLAQTYENWEVILVVTMSEDKTEKVAGEYQRKDSRIRCLDNEGKGISSARNKGLSAAEGEYLLFMDADDYLPDPCVLQRYLNIAEKISSDIIVSNYARLWKERFLPAETHQNFSVCHRNSEEFLLPWLLFRRDPLLCMGETVPPVVSGGKRSSVRGFSLCGGQAFQYAVLCLWRKVRVC